MIAKFANPHLSSQNLETTTRAENAIQTTIATSYVVQDEETDSLKRRLDDMLRDTWADSLVLASNLQRSPKRRKVAETHENVQDKLAFRLVSSMKNPQHISLEPKPLPLPPIRTREPDCEDDQAQAEERRMRALSVAVDIGTLGQPSVSTARLDHKSRIVEAKLPLPDTAVPRSLPPLLVIEESRTLKNRITYLQRIRSDDPQDFQRPAASPHEPRVSSSCLRLPVTSVPNRRGTSRKKRRKSIKERPPPVYWRPPAEVRGKCMGYALGYPRSWASSGSHSSDRPYVRDVMKKGVHLTPT